MHKAHHELGMEAAEREWAAGHEAVTAQVSSGREIVTELTRAQVGGYHLADRTLDAAVEHPDQSIAALVAHEQPLSPGQLATVLDRVPLHGQYGMDGLQQAQRRLGVGEDVLQEARRRQHPIHV